MEEGVGRLDEGDGRHAEQGDVQEGETDQSIVVRQEVGGSADDRRTAGGGSLLDVGVLRGQTVEEGAAFVHRSAP